VKRKEKENCAHQKSNKGTQRQNRHTETKEGHHKSQTEFSLKLTYDILSGKNAHIIPKGVPEWTAVELLYILLALQVFWGWLIVKVLYKLIRDGHAEDNRSDDEGGAEEDPSEEDSTADIQKEE